MLLTLIVEQQLKGEAPAVFNTHLLEYLHVGFEDLAFNNGALRQICKELERMALKREVFS